MKRRKYSLEAPDQQRLKVARATIEGVLKEHDIAGVVILHTPGMTEFFYDVTPSYSRVWIDERAGMLRMKSKLSEYGGDKAAQELDQRATANMVSTLADALERSRVMFYSMATLIDQLLDAQHTDTTYVPDPQEGNKQ